MTDKDRETHLWQFDPSVFQPSRKAGFLERHLLGKGRALVRNMLYMAAFAYPIILVTLGVAFGGIVFWTSFAGSGILIFLIIKKAGYSANFAGWNIGYTKILGLVGAFVIYLGLVYGLIYIHLWTIPIMAAILAAVFLAWVWRAGRH